ncbi:MAG TPA: hypothetical protein VIN12_06330 [Candidatus Dormibacteraeota bacterium]
MRQPRRIAGQKLDRKAVGSVSLAEELQSLGPAVQPSPWPGHEWVEGFGVMAMPFTSGHVLVLRAFPHNSFAPYKSIWHRTPEGTWTIFVDGASMETACPRYFGAAAKENRSARIDLTWIGPMDLEVTAEPPGLRWTMSLTEPPYLRALNAASSRLPEAAWRSSFVLRGMELMASVVLGMGEVQLAGPVPSGHWATLTPRRMYFVRDAHAELAGIDLGTPVRAATPPRIGATRLPSKPAFAVGRAFFRLG